MDKIAVIYDFRTNASKILKKLIPDEERDLLGIFLKDNGIDPKSIYFCFAYPTETTKTDKATLTLAREKLLENLKKEGVTKALVCGTTAYQVLIGHSGFYNISKFWGKAFEVEGIYCVLAPSPAQILKIHTATSGRKTQPDADRIRDFQICIEKLISHSKVMPLPDYKYTVVQTVEELENLLKCIDAETNSPVAVDTETTGLDAINNSLLCLGLGYFYAEKTIDNPDCGHMIVIPKEILYQPHVDDLLNTFFTRYMGRFVFHNAKFDLKFLGRYLGTMLDPENIDDTIMMSYLLDERPIGWFGNSSHGLKDQSRIWFDAEDYHFDFEAFYATPEDERDYEKLHYYLSLDLVYTLGLYQKLSLKMDEEYGLWRPYKQLIIPATVALAEIELHGAKVDIEYLKQLKEDYEDKLEDQIESLQGLAGGSDFNPNSPQKVKKTIENLSGGMLIPISTNKATLTDLVDNSECGPVVDFCEKMLEYRETSKTLSTYIESLIEKADKNGYIHADFNLNGTATGRLSCSHPNLQNIPFNQGPVIRRSFCAAPGYDFVTVDYSQLELRVAAWISHEENMFAAFKTGRDIHQEFASKIFGIPYDQVDKVTRKKGKTLVFGMLYGLSAWSIAKKLGITKEEAEALKSSLLDSFPGFSKWAEKIKKEVNSNQEVISPMGRVRRWPLLTPLNKSAAEREAVNSPIQSMASDICLTSLINLHNELKKYQSFITFTVHDSLEFEIKHEFFSEAILLIITEMTSVFSNDDIIFKVDVDAGPNWAESKEVVLNAE